MENSFRNENLQGHQCRFINKQKYINRILCFYYNKFTAHKKEIETKTLEHKH